MRSVVWEFHENKAGTKLFQLLSLENVSLTNSLKLLTFSSHDFNDNIGKVKVQSFQEKYPEAIKDFKSAWVEYMKYCYQVETGEEVNSVTMNWSSTTLIVLDTDPKGYPLLPPPNEDENLVNKHEAHYPKLFYSPLL